MLNGCDQHIPSKKKVLSVNILMLKKTKKSYK